MSLDIIKNIKMPAMAICSKSGKIDEMADTACRHFSYGSVLPSCPGESAASLGCGSGVGSGVGVGSDGIVVGASGLDTGCGVGVFSGGCSDF